MKFRKETALDRLFLYDRAVWFIFLWQHSIQWTVVETFTQNRLLQVISNCSAKKLQIQQKSIAGSFLFCDNTIEKEFSLIFEIYFYFFYNEYAKMNDCREIRQFEVIILLHLAPALRVKDVTIFDLVDQEFYYGEFIFFSRLAAHLSRVAGISAEDGQEIGVLSELMYLSSKIHFSLQETVASEQELRAGLQMPVLIGDLLYGRFIVYLTEAGKKDLLPVYMEYLRTFNAEQVRALQKKQETPGASYICLLAEKTADAVVSLADKRSVQAGQLRLVAENYFKEQWTNMQGAPITQLAVLENALQAEMF